MEQTSDKNIIEETETLGEVFKSRRILLIILSLLLIFATAFSFVLNAANMKKTEIYPGYWAPDLDIHTIDVISGDTGVYSGTVLTETARVEDSYFASTVFIGDSLTQGLSLFDVFDNFIQVAMLGINPQNALTEKFYEIDGEKVTMADAVEYYKPQKIYIMLGANGINTNTTEWLIENYEILVDELMRRVTGCQIVIQSITPVTREKAKADPEHYSLENIHKYNDMLRDMALRKGLYFLDVYSSIADEEGYMPSGITSGDGIHMKREGYIFWYDYLMTHIIQGDSAYLISADGQMVPAPESSYTVAEETGEAVESGAEAVGEGIAPEEGSPAEADEENPT